MKRMTKKSELHKKAVARFHGSYNCAQSVLWTMFEHWDGKNELIPKIATAFGAGLGRCGSLCGALAGGIMAIGVKYGSNEPSAEKRLEAYELAAALYKRFEAKHGTVLCRELTGYDFSKPEESEKAKAAKVFEEKCTEFVKDVIDALLEFEGH
jgi:C_GCAxxG_C_C family probable redox protein